MNYEDFGEILQDDFTGTLFGDEGQLEVIGWYEKSKGHKLYAVLCKTCATDKELNGDGLFKSLKCNLNRGQIPCGCSSRVCYTENQYFILCQRKAYELGYKFLGWATPYRRLTTKIKLICDVHGEWSSGSIHSFVLNGSGCPACRTEALRQSRLKEDSEMIASFFASGAFHPETKFWRSERKTKQNRAVFWKGYCPVCNEFGESTCDSLQLGKKFCACSNHSQKFCYIHMVSDGEIPLALKFGIASNPESRLVSQNRKSPLKVQPLEIYLFHSTQSCKSAERECKSSLICGILDRQLLPDGWTETTYISNLSRIKEIFKEMGGILYEPSNKVG